MIFIIWGMIIALMIVLNVIEVVRRKKEEKIQLRGNYSLLYSIFRNLMDSIWGLVFGMGLQVFNVILAVKDVYKRQIYNLTAIFLQQ